MASVTEIFTLSNPAYVSYLFYTGVLCAKIMLMAILTSKQRMTKKAFANPEDAKSGGGKVKADDDVERVRRAHLNDLENIPVFMFISAIYLLTNPSTFIAVWLMRIFTIARIVHTIVYAVVVIPQPARGLAFGVGMFINFYMCYRVIVTFMSGM